MKKQVRSVFLLIPVCHNSLSFFSFYKSSALWSVPLECFCPFDNIFEMFIVKLRIIFVYKTRLKRDFTATRVVQPFVEGKNVFLWLLIFV